MPLACRARCGVSPDPGMSFEEWSRRMGIKPGAPGPITGPDLVKLLDVVGALSVGDPGRHPVLTIEQIIAELRDLLGEEQTIAESDVMPLLPGDSFEAINGGYRWK